jgi:(p)ppGpp synthase/HD superfamily hydrolase
MNQDVLSAAFALVGCSPSGTKPLDESNAARCAEAYGVSGILREWGASPVLQAAGALASVATDAPAGLDEAEIARCCGDAVASLFRQYREFCATSPMPLTRRQDDAGVLQGGVLQGGTRGENRRGEPLVLQRIHAYCAAYRNPDLAFLYAAVLWHRFCIARTAEGPFRRNYEEEARQLLGPFLEMLGMRELCSRVDHWLAERTAGGAGTPLQLTPAQLAHLSAPLQAALPQAEFSPGRYTQTHISTTGSLASSSSPVMAPLTVDALVTDLAECYTLLYHIHQTYTIIDGGVTDQLSVGRVNGYRCLSSTVLADLPMEADAEGATIARGAGKRKVRIQFRIATRELDEINRWGLAAFQLRGRLAGPLPPGWWNDTESGWEQIAVDAAGALPETLYVFSPHGQLFKFNRGATVVDYAYHVHSELADRCLRFTVNGETVEPATVLRHLDLVELEHDAHAPGPTQAWLNAARTSRARTKIQRYLKRRGHGAFQGQQILRAQIDRLAEHYGFTMPDYRLEQMVRRTVSTLQLTSPDDFYNEIAAGRLDARGAMAKFFTEEIVGQIELPDGRLRRKTLYMAQCCHPRPGEPIVGRARRRGGSILYLKVHRADCPRIGDLAEGSEDRIPLGWRLQPKLNLLAQIEMLAQNDDGLLGDAIAQIYAVLPRANLHRVEAVARRGVAHMTFIVEAEDKEVLDRIARALETLPERAVDQVRIMDVPPTEREDLASVLPSAFNNPYSRMPVNEREMFFGRKAELERISGDLQANVGAIWLRGQKRVGKTSLLFYLKRSYLASRGFIPAYVDFQMLSHVDGPMIFYDIAAHIYSDLQDRPHRAAGQIDELGPPLRELFEHEPARQLMSYLQSIQSRLGQDRLVLLLDEFSRTIDAWQQDRLPVDFFDQWRGLMLNTPGINFVTVIQQRTYDRLSEEAPSPEREPVWELLELGEQLVLRPLGKDDVRRLIEWPIQGVLEYSPALVDYMADLTGGSPFLIQAFCRKLVATMNRRDAKQVSREDIEAVCREFMHPNESLFAHLLDLIQGIGALVVQALADLAATAEDGSVTWAQLREALPEIKPAQLRRTLVELSKQDILIEENSNRWRFASLLFRQWLYANPIA